MIEKIKCLPQTDETLKDLYDLAVQREDKAKKIATSQWIRRECMKLKTAASLELVCPQQRINRIALPLRGLILAFYPVDCSETALFLDKSRLI